MNDPALSASDLNLLSDVLDEVIPASADGRLPAAGALGIGDDIAATLRQQPELRAGLAAGLVALRELARARGASGLPALSGADRKGLLDELATKAPAFMPTIVLHAYLGYYRHPRVLEALGLEGRPPFPKGYEVAPTDFAILDAVRARAPMYRKP